jgi:hypothetical protein
MADTSDSSWEDEFPNYNPRAPVMGDRAKQLANPSLEQPSWEDNYPTITTQDANRASRPRNWGETMHSVATETLKGIPIAGNYMPNLIAKGQAAAHGGNYEDKLANIEAQSKSFGEDNPLTTMGLRTAGGVLSTAPLSGALASASLPGNMLMQGGLFGTLAAADTAAKRYKETGQIPDYPELGKDFTSGAFWGGVPGPLIGKAIAPAGIKGAPRTGSVTPEVAQRMQDAFGRKPSSGAIQKTYTPPSAAELERQAQTWGPLWGATIAGGLGHFAGGHITEPAVLGALLGPSFYKMGSNLAGRAGSYLVNRQAHPQTLDLLNALMAQKGQRPSAEY